MDKKDKQLLMMLQENSRESLTNLAKKVNLSIDSTHKRLNKLINSGVVNRFGAFINPKVLGYDLVVDVKIKLHNVTEQELKSIINYLTKHPNCIELISVSGDFSDLWNTIHYDGKGSMPNNYRAEINKLINLCPVLSVVCFIIG